MTENELAVMEALMTDTAYQEIHNRCLAVANDEFENIKEKVSGDIDSFYNAFCVGYIGGMLNMAAMVAEDGENND